MVTRWPSKETMVNIWPDVPTAGSEENMLTLFLFIWPHQLAQLCGLSKRQMSMACIDLKLIRENILGFARTIACPEILKIMLLLKEVWQLKGLHLLLTLYSQLQEKSTFSQMWTPTLPGATAVAQVLSPTQLRSMSLIPTCPLLFGLSRQQQTAKSPSSLTPESTWPGAPTAGSEASPQIQPSFMSHPHLIQLLCGHRFPYLMANGLSEVT